MPLPSHGQNIHVYVNGCDAAMYIFSGRACSVYTSLNVSVDEDRNGIPYQSYGCDDGGLMMMRIVTNPRSSIKHVYDTVDTGA